MNIIEQLDIFALGIFAFFCLDIVIKTATRAHNKVEYSQWHRRMYALWGVTMGYVFLCLMFDLYFILYNTDSDSNLLFSTRIFDLLVIQIGGLWLWTLTSHKQTTLNQIFWHFVPFFVFSFVACIAHLYLPQWHLEYILFFFEFIYVMVVGHRLIKNIDEYNERLQQSYTDPFRRSLNWTLYTVWIMIIDFVIFFYFNYSETFYGCIYYPIATFTLYFVNWNVIYMRDTSEVVDLTDELGSESIDEDDGFQSDIRQYLDLELENICVEHRLFLNPNLTISELAEALNTKRSYIAHYFENRNTTFLRYINNLRTEYAMYQLKNTKDPLLDIMNQSGFTHQETFDRAFKVRYNCLPSEVRREKSSPQ